jgi:hypothetical protein
MSNCSGWFRHVRVVVVALASAISIGCNSDNSTSGSVPAAQLTSGGTPSTNPTVSTNSAPTISGTPPAVVLVGNTYMFQPMARDADGNALTYSVKNLPSWASFDAATGLISGTPSAMQVGTYTNVQVTVTDGLASVSSEPFSIAVTQTATGSATLAWAAPSRNTDGSALTNLAGYRIHYGTKAAKLDKTITIATTGISNYVVTDLSPGKWYFAVESYNTAKVGSSLSTIVSKTI